MVLSNELIIVMRFSHFGYSKAVVLAIESKFLVYILTRLFLDCEKLWKISLIVIWLFLTIKQTQSSDFSDSVRFCNMFDY